MKIGLVLSGGGMRGMAHIGAIHALEEHGIIPTHIAGSSVGAVVGALYAYGYDWKEMLSFFRTIQIFELKRYAVNKPGIMDAEKFYSVFKLYLKEDNFSVLKKQLFVTATNVLNGKLAIFNTGELIKPILASAAFPGIFAPVNINGSYYVDGGVLNNFPVDLLKNTCDVIIGVYVNGFDTVVISDLKHSHNVVERVFKLKTVREDIKKFKKCDLIIYPKQLSKYGTFDKKYLDAIYKIGYDAANKELVNQQLLNKIFPLKAVKSDNHHSKIALRKRPLLKTPIHTQRMECDECKANRTP
ncbi:NTE family protein RssA [Mariniflexile rhizosphaerae]|uniref:patatin-like phospholipase family protein n=1 Tax=unclassified Mariniflexile TaxID=2643887 RepID=UPI000CB4D702|nr:patatin-like phospholipase family protein [Mariniflexile sp. TRM1-10]AXP82242.1 NTE family protein RssA [Mariniflexile sp. TRM1-10]PLB19192.1 MAG: Patatin-like phospholipase [Flavobacteriaceae bacterium FS1-H7996/R]